jgi:hypothetical protein
MTQPATRVDDHGANAVVVSVRDRGRLEDLVEPFGGRVHCHAPADRPFSYEALCRPDDGRDRWGAPGARTVDLAGDPAVALAEYARQRQPGAPADSRCIWTFRLGAVTVLDLRRPAVTDCLGLDRGARVFLDRQLSRAVSGTIRATGLCQGLLVPSMAFLDRPERFNVVLFGEQLGRDVEGLLTDRRAAGEIRLEGT